MNKRLTLLASGALVLLAVAACSNADSTNAAGRASSYGGMPAGMIMPDGSTMGAPATTASSGSAGPSDAARMICTEDTRHNLATALGDESVAAGPATWSDSTYTCHYQLSAGRITLSVHESASDKAAATYAQHLRTSIQGAHAVAGLTSDAFADASGRVVLVKDNDTLEVDARAMPAVFGSQNEHRNDFAYEIASDVLGCWTGDS